MKYVVDAATAFMWEVSEPDSPKALRLRDDYRAGLIELLAPDLFPAEIANAFLVAERRGRIAKGQYPVLLTYVLATLPILHGTVPLLPRVVAITSTTQMSVYDCLYVALAEREGCELVTGDKKLVHGHQHRFPFIRSIATLP